MPAVIWTPAMSVGIEALDTDHKMLFGLINQLDRAVAEGSADDIVASIINGLVDYTEYHFGREEAMLRAVGFAGLDAHLAHHRALVKTLHDLRDDYTGGRRRGIERALLDFMHEWITDHVLAEDMKYAPDLKGRAAELDRVDEQYSQGLLVRTP